MIPKHAPINIEEITHTLDFAMDALQQLIDDPASYVLEREAYAEVRARLNTIILHLNT